MSGLSQDFADVDVFLAYSHIDSEAGATVRHGLQAAKFRVFDATEVSAEESISDEAWHALAVCNAFVVVRSSEATSWAWVGVELGAAMAWTKPVFVVQTGPATTSLPDFLRKFPVFPLSRLDDVIQGIRQALEPIRSELRGPLEEVYLELSVPVDGLILNPALLQEFSHRFQKKTNLMLSGEKLILELLKLRKRGVLSPIRKGGAVPRAG